MADSNPPISSAPRQNQGMELDLIAIDAVRKRCSPCRGCRAGTRRRCGIYT